MGYRAVEALVGHLRGDPVEAVVDTGVRVVTRENLADPEIQRLLQ
jgi:ABC-type sugar transport system substrate-binding protein